MSAPEPPRLTDEQWEQMRRVGANLVTMAEAFRNVDWAGLHAALEKLAFAVEDARRALERDETP